MLDELIELLNKYSVTIEGTYDGSDYTITWRENGKDFSLFLLTSDKIIDADTLSANKQEVEDNG